MAKIERAEVIQKLIQELRLDAGREKMPVELADKILGVFNVNPLPEVKTSTKTTSDATTSNMITLSTTKRTFVIAASITVSKDVNAASAVQAVNVIMAGSATAVPLIVLRNEPSTASSFSYAISFPIPIELVKGSTVTVTSNNATASVDVQGTLFFYETEV